METSCSILWLLCLYVSTTLSSSTRRGTKKRTETIEDAFSKLNLQPKSLFTDDLADYGTCEGENEGTSCADNPNSAAIEGIEHMRVARHVGNGIKCVVKRVGKMRESEVLLALNQAPTSAFIERLHHHFQEKSVPGTNRKPDVYEVLEFIAGQNLLEWRDRVGDGISGEEIRDCIAQIVLGVRFMHSRGIFHNDLKPDNVMRTPEGRFVIIDFDLSEWIVQNPWPDNLHCGSSREASLLYSSPEKVFANVFPTFFHAEIDWPIGHNEMEDFYGIGVILHHLYCGTYPYADKMYTSLVQQFFFNGQAPELEPCKRLLGDASALDLARRLLHFDMTQRLGARGGFAELERHQFFRQNPAGAPAAAFWADVERKARNAQRREDAESAKHRTEIVPKSNSTKNGSQRKGTKHSRFRRSGKSRPDSKPQQ